MSYFYKPIKRSYLDPDTNEWKAVITIQGSVTKILCLTYDELHYYTTKLTTKGEVFTIHFFRTLREVNEFMERGV